MVLMHGELPDTPGAVLADENLEKAILLWQVSFNGRILIPY